MNTTTSIFGTVGSCTCGFADIPAELPCEVHDTFGRLFNRARQQQGFRSQRHLDAFYAYHDHRSHCSVCQQFGPKVPAYNGDGYYQTLQSCEESDTLFRLWHSL